MAVDLPPAPIAESLQCCTLISAPGAYVPDLHRILLAEDDGLIGWDLSDELEGAGFAVAGPFATVAETLAYLSEHTPSAAIVDVLLQDASCDALADALRARGIPFLVHSGTSPRYLGEALETVPWLEKPAKLAVLIAALATLLPEAVPGSSFAP